MASVDADLLNSRIRRALFDLGQAVIGHTRVRNRQCLKFTFTNPAVSDLEVEDLLKTILERGRQFEAETDEV